MPLHLRGRPSYFFLFCPSFSEKWFQPPQQKTITIPPGLRASEARSQDLNRQFFQYSRLWWKEYIEIDPSFKERLVKIFAEDEWGGHRPVCSYVTPLSAGRLLDSPRHAARFVSLIPYTKVEAVGSGSGQGRMERPPGSSGGGAGVRMVLPTRCRPAP